MVLHFEAIQTTFIGVPSAGTDLHLWLVEAQGPHLAETGHADPLVVELIPSVSAAKAGMESFLVEDVEAPHSSFAPQWSSPLLVGVHQFIPKISQSSPINSWVSQPSWKAWWPGLSDQSPTRYEARRKTYPHCPLDQLLKCDQLIQSGFDLNLYILSYINYKSILSYILNLHQIDIAVPTTDQSRHPLHLPVRSRYLACERVKVPVHRGPG